MGRGSSKIGGGGAIQKPNHMGIAEIRDTEEGRALIDSIEEAEEEMRGRGINPGDTSEFWSNAYDRDVETLYDEFGYDYDGRFADSIPRSIAGKSLQLTDDTHVTGSSRNELNSNLNDRGLAFQREYFSSTSRDTLMDLVGSDGRMYTGTLNRYFDGGLELLDIKLRPDKSGSRR